MNAIGAMVLAVAAVGALTVRGAAQQPPPPKVQLPAVQDRPASAKTLTGRIVSINRRDGTIVVEESDGGDKGGGKPPKLLLDIAQLPAASIANLRVGDRISVQYSALGARNVASRLQTIMGPAGPRP